MLFHQIHWKDGRILAAPSGRRLKLVESWENWMDGCFTECNQNWFTLVRHTSIATYRNSLAMYNLSFSLLLCVSLLTIFLPPCVFFPSPTFSVCLALSYIYSLLLTHILVLSPPPYSSSFYLYMRAGVQKQAWKEVLFCVWCSPAKIRILFIMNFLRFLFFFFLFQFFF